jgi:hypothetical protein
MAEPMSAYIARRLLLRRLEDQWEEIEEKLALIEEVKKQVVAHSDSVRLRRGISVDSGGVRPEALGMKEDNRGAKPERHRDVSYSKAYKILQNLRGKI